MHKVLKRVAFAGCLLLGAPSAIAQAQGDAPPPRSKPAGRVHERCFYADQVNNYSAPDEETVYVRVGVRDVYKLETFGPCPDIDWSQGIALVSRGGSWVCTGADVDLVVRDRGGGARPQRCAVRVVRQLTPAEIEALPKRDRP